MHSSSRITCRNDEEKKSSAARLAYKSIFPVFFEQTNKLSDADMFSLLRQSILLHPLCTLNISPGISLFSVPGECWGILQEILPGVGNSTFAWVGWGKLNRNCQVSSDFFGGEGEAPKSLIAINKCLDEIREFKEREHLWLTKKGLQRL